jgi:hypothetical protein
LLEKNGEWTPPRGDKKRGGVFLPFFPFALFFCAGL